MLSEIGDRIGDTIEALSQILCYRRPETPDCILDRRPEGLDCIIHWRLETIDCIVDQRP